MATGTIQFRGDLMKFADEVNVELGHAVQKITQDMHTEVTVLTPVDTGRLRAAWVMGVGAPPETVPPEIPQDVLDAREEKKKKGEKVDAILPPPDPLDVSGIDGKSPVFLVNNLEYAEAIEDGHSKQRPNGMLKVAVETVSAKFLSDGGSFLPALETVQLSPTPIPPATP